MDQTYLWLISSCSWFNYPHLAGIELGTINWKYHRKSVAFDIPCDKICAWPGTVKHVYCRFNKRVFLVYSGHCSCQDVNPENSHCGSEKASFYAIIIPQKNLLLPLVIMLQQDLLYNLYSRHGIFLQIMPVSTFVPQDFETMHFSM